MSLGVNIKYIAKSFGDYTLEVCSKTKYFNGLHLLSVCNETHNTQKKLKYMIEYIGRSKFMKQTIADFNYLSDKKLIDYEYLNNLCNNEVGRILRPAQISSETSIDNILALSTNIKFKYMIRENSTKIGNTKTISSLDINPMTAVGIAMWMSPDFGSKVKDIFLRFIEGDATLIKESVENLNAITGKVNNIQVASNPEDGSALVLVKTHEKDSFDAKYEYNKLKREMKEMEDMYKGIIIEKDDNISKLTVNIDILTTKIDKQSVEIAKLLGYSIDTNKKLNAVLPNAVKDTDINVNKLEYLTVLYVPKRVSKRRFRIIRGQKNYNQSVINEVKSEFRSTECILNIKVPNAMKFWESVIVNSEIILGNDSKITKWKGQWYGSENITKRNLLRVINHVREIWMNGENYPVDSDISD